MGHLITLFPKNKIIVKDSFNRADSATTMGNANTGQAWVVNGGAWGISNNQAYSIDSVGTDYSYIDAGKSDVTVSVNAKFSVNEGITFRYTDINNSMTARISSTSLALIRIVGGTGTVIGTYSFSPIVGNIYAIKVLCVGSLIKVYLDGIERISINETANQTATKFGMKTVASTAGRFDDFLEEAL